MGPGIKYEASPKTVQVEGRDWDKVKKAIRNFVFNNFNPGLLRHGHPLRSRILDGIESTTGLFLALEPQIFVSKIRCRVFRSWKAAEDYYANSLRVAQSQMKGEPVDEIIEDEEEATPSTVNEKHIKGNLFGVQVNEHTPEPSRLRRPAWEQRLVKRFVGLLLW